MRLATANILHIFSSKYFISFYLPAKVIFLSRQSTPKDSGYAQ